MRWSQLGFGRTSTTSRAQATPRNLMGFKDGTNNLKAEDVGRAARHVWVGRPPTAPAWLRDGTYMVTRRIRMLIEVWDRASLQDQEQTIGRAQGVRARPWREATSTTTVKVGRHARRRPHPPRRARRPTAACAILRRGYSFTDGSTTASASSTPASSSSAFQRDPERQFVASSAGSAPTTSSTSTSSTRLGRCSRCRPASGRADTWARGCWRERSSRRTRASWRCA